MRDILITAIILGFLPFVLRSPRVGTYMWAWIALMVPHRAAFGFARTLPFAQMVAIATMIGFVFSKERKPFPISSVTVVHLLFVLWMSVTSLFAMHAPEVVRDAWVLTLKIHIMLFITMMLIRGREQIDRLVMVVALSIAFYGIKGGFWTLATGGGGRVWGPSGGVVEGNNELGVALVAVIPFMYYLLLTSKRRLVRYGLIVAIGMTAVGILGTQSRGALLALLTMALVLGFKGKNPMRTTLIIGLFIALAIAFMPDSWTRRMDTIQSFEQDGSAMSRVYTWQTLWNAALDRPLVGVGFRTDNPAVFAKYAPIGGVGSYQAGGIWVAHSIYFQALGEHGFPGLALYLLLGITAWRKAAALSKQAQDDAQFREWVPLLMRMAQVSIVGFAVGGAFLTLVHFDLPYYLVAFVVLVDATMREQARRAPVGVVPAKASG